MAAQQEPIGMSENRIARIFGLVLDGPFICGLVLNALL
jgi:hypothetical protein